MKTTTNTNSTKYYSNKQEKAVSNLLSGYVNSASGAGLFKKGDITIRDASLLIECKTTMTEKTSFSIKSEWLEKLKKEANSQRIFNTALAFNFAPDGHNYFVIDEKLMKFLVDKLREEES